MIHSYIKYFNFNFNFNFNVVNISDTRPIILRTVAKYPKMWYRFSH